MTIQSEYDLKYNAALSNGSSLPVEAVTISGGHIITNTLVMNPWVKIKSDSPAYLNFSANQNATAIDISNRQNINEPMLAVSNMGPCLDGSHGVIAVEGDGMTNSMLAVSIGNDIAGGICRDVEVNNIAITGFATGVEFKSKDTYLCKISNSRIQSCMVGVSVPYDVDMVNSGERHSIINTVFGSCGEGISVDNAGIEFNIINTSLDFCQKTALRLGVNSGYQKISFTDCHLEGSNNEALIISHSNSGSGIFVDLKSCKIVPTNGSDPVRGGLPTGARPDGKSLPRDALFKGKMNLVLDGLVIAYNYPSHNANAGFFLVDNDVNLISAENISYIGYKQVIAASKVLNDNWLFDGTLNAAGDKLDVTNDIEGWSYVTSQNIDAELSSDQVFMGSDKSLKFTCTGASNWFVMEGSVFNVNPNDKILNQNAVYGGLSTGKIRVQWQLLQYKEDGNGNLILLDESVSSGSDFQDLYNDTNDPSYNNGDRNMWFKEKTLTERVIKSGATKAKIKITVSSMDSGDIIYLGAITANRG